VSDAPTEHQGGELAVAEVALGLVTAAVVIGFGRILDGAYAATLLAVAFSVHVAAAVLRRRRVPVSLAAVGVAAVTALTLVWFVFPSSTVVGLPTGETLDAVRQAMGTGWSDFRSAVAPAPVQPGFLVAAGVAIAVSAFLADWAAFRLWSPFEAVVPATALFVFCSLLGGTRGQVAAAAVFAATVVFFQLAHRVARQARSSSWVTSEVRRASQALLGAGAALGCAAVVIGVVVAPALPGADDEAVLDWQAGQARSGQRVTISPLVDIRSRLVDQGDVELFTVEATQRSYWRLTSLDTYAEGIWKSSGKYRAVNGNLPDGPATSATMTRSEQVFSIEALAALWLPAAFEPSAIEAPTDVRFHAESSTLIVDTDVASSDNLVYRVQSDIPAFTPEQLRAADEPPPEDVAATYLTLPDTTSPVAVDAAADVTAVASTDYDRALALQNWFQSEFSYSLEVQPGHSEDAIGDFLANKVGYCEQFAGTFAVMARSLGIPARVAVGFTPGEQDPDVPTRFSVRGANAHAWPEVWLGNAGWVAFEPTPGRGAPGAEEYTGLPESQAAAGSATTATTLATTTSTTADTATGPAAPTTSTLPGAAQQVDELAAGFGEEDAEGSRRIGAFAALLLLGVVAYVVAVPAALSVRRRRRRNAAATPSAQVDVAWVESVEDLAALGAVQRAAETPAEFVDRIGEVLPEHAGALRVLAADADAAWYSPEEPADDTARAARATSGAVADAVADRLGLVGRLRRRLDPTPLVRGLRDGRRHTAASGRG